MSLTILKAILVCGIIGHAINMYCDRLLSIFPNGVIKFSNFDDLKDSKKMAKLMDGVSEKIPMRSAILGAFAIFLEVLGYYALTAYMYEHSNHQDLLCLLSGIHRYPDRCNPDRRCHFPALGCDLYHPADRYRHVATWHHRNHAHRSHDLLCCLDLFTVKLNT